MWLGNTQADDTLPSIGVRGGANCWITPGLHTSYGYSNPIGYQTSDFRLLWTITPNPQPPKPPMIGLCPPPPKYQTCALPPISDLPPPPPFSLAQFCTLLP